MNPVLSDRGATPDDQGAELGSVGANVPRPGDEAATLSALWTELISGFCKVRQVTFSAQTCDLLVKRQHRAEEPPSLALPARDVEILERALTEGVRKSVAADFKLCPSSVAEILRRCFVFMGLSCWPSRIPLVLVLAAYAKCAPEARSGAKTILAQNQQFERQTISISRPDNELSLRLSPAEYAVTRLLIEGKSYVEIAAIRQTSKRTVANQLASGFHRLGISGRADLLCLLAQQKLVDWQSAAARPRALALAQFEGGPGFARVAVGQQG